TIEEAGKLFFTASPGWIRRLVITRDRIVRTWGLKTAARQKDPEKALTTFQAEIGQRIGLFKVLERTTEELILGENDSHLDFRVSLLLSSQNIHKRALIISTAVRFHNLWGNIYFFLIQPFHKILVPVILKNIIRET